MARYIIECDSPDDIVFGVVKIKRFMTDGIDGYGSELFSSDGKGRLWVTRKTKAGYSARDVDYVMGKREDV